MIVNILRGLEYLQRSTAESAGYDLSSRINCVIKHGEIMVVPTGVVMQVQPGFFAAVCSRSGLAARHGVVVANAPGIIDSDYRGEVNVILTRLIPGTTYITENDRIAQLVFQPCATPKFKQVASLPPTGRGTGGLGSTGK